LLAVLAVAVFVLVSYTVVISGDPSPTAGDVTALNVAESIQLGWLTSVAKVVTELGSAAVVIPLAAVCAVALAAARRWPEFWVLVVGTLIVFLGVNALKDAIDRPRPGGGLVEARGFSFPSGHAAQAVIYIWAAATVGLRLRPGTARVTALVLGGVALTALVGLSRVYLHVHYLSDVSAGWALGVSAYTMCALVALVGLQLRQNGRGAVGENRT
jgi:undecaprenyl-diphosphatase